jgi:UDP-3-O-[3-hydroxymyristoyl] glucosamine N-acyltransferase
MRVREHVTIHPTADVSDDAQIGAGTRVWHQAQVREGAVIGSECILGFHLPATRGGRAKPGWGIPVTKGALI